MAGYDGPVTEPSTTATDDGASPTTQSDPGERRLARPPSERYRVAEVVDAPQPRPTSPGRGLLFATLVGVVGALAITFLGGVLTLTGGLLVAAAVLGWGTGWALKIGAGASLSSRRRVVAAVVVAVAAVLLGQVGLWLYAGTEGGVLSLTEYLGETFGPLVPLQALIAPMVAWATAR